MDEQELEVVLSRNIGYCPNVTECIEQIKHMQEKSNFCFFHKELLHINHDHSQSSSLSNDNEIIEIDKCLQVFVDDIVNSLYLDAAQKDLEGKSQTKIQRDFIKYANNHKHKHSSMQDISSKLQGPIRMRARKRIQVQDNLGNPIYIPKDELVLFNSFDTSNVGYEVWKGLVHQHLWIPSPQQELYLEIPKDVETIFQNTKKGSSILEQQYPFMVVRATSNYAAKTEKEHSFKENDFFVLIRSAFTSSHWPAIKWEGSLCKTLKKVEESLKLKFRDQPTEDFLKSIKCLPADSNLFTLIHNAEDIAACISTSSYCNLDIEGFIRTCKEPTTVLVRMLDNAGNLKKGDLIILELDPFNQTNWVGHHFNHQHHLLNQKHNVPANSKLYSNIILNSKDLPFLDLLLTLHGKKSDFRRFPTKLITLGRLEKSSIARGSIIQAQLFAGKQKGSNVCVVVPFSSRTNGDLITKEEDVLHLFACPDHKTLCPGCSRRARNHRGEEGSYTPRSLHHYPIEVEENSILISVIQDFSAYVKKKGFEVDASLPVSLLSVDDFSLKHESDGEGDVHALLEHVDIILRSFGFASVANNPESQRFWRHTLLGFDADGDIMAAGVEIYSLEMDRVVDCVKAPGESNFFVFYELLQESEYLDPQVKYNLLPPVDLQPEKLLSNFRKLKHSLRVFFEEEEIQFIFKLIAAIVHVANIDFGVVEKAGTVESITDKVCELLGVTKEIMWDNIQDGANIKIWFNNLIEATYSWAFTVVISRIKERIQNNRINLEGGSSFAASVVPIRLITGPGWLSPNKVTSQSFAFGNNSNIEWFFNLFFTTRWPNQVSDAETNPLQQFLPKVANPRKQYRMQFQTVQERLVLQILRQNKFEFTERTWAWNQLYADRNYLNGRLPPKERLHKYFTDNPSFIFCLSRPDGTPIGTHSKLAQELNVMLRIPYEKSPPTKKHEMIIDGQKFLQFYLRYYSVWNNPVRVEGQSLISHLPREVLHYIFQFVELRDWVVLSQVCRLWQQIVIQPSALQARREYMTLSQAASDTQPFSISQTTSYKQQVQALLKSNPELHGIQTEYYVQVHNNSKSRIIFNLQFIDDEDIVFLDLKSIQSLNRMQKNPYSIRYFSLKCDVQLGDSKEDGIFFPLHNTDLSSLQQSHQIDASSYSRLVNGTQGSVVKAVVSNEINGWVWGYLLSSGNFGWFPLLILKRL